MMSCFMQNQNKYAKIVEYLNGLDPEYINLKNQEQVEKDLADFAGLKVGLFHGFCYFCKKTIDSFEIDRPCMHWLLHPPGFKKKYLGLLFEQKGFHELNAYVRWIANTEKPAQNINDISDEKSRSKLIEETIRYKNFEWSFSCSQGDRSGHIGSFQGAEPHYHFQMKLNERVIIKYNDFHAPFNDYDEFAFVVKSGKFEKLKEIRMVSAGMEELLTHISADDILEKMVHTDDLENAQFNVRTILVASEGYMISGDEIADLLEERKRTGVPFAKLAQKLQNVSAQIIVQSGPGVPQISTRERKKKSR